ncbi:MAG TPA: disulfide bond formation protein B [Alphaproteobacteria bacterium]
MMDQITPRQFALGLAAISAAALLAALTAQYGFDLAPCVLCIYQRIPYGIIIVLGGLAGFGPAKWTKTALGLITVMLAAEFAIAAFHVGVEQKWWEGTESCNINFEGASLDQIREQILNGPRARCGDIAWSLFGISMAGYNALLSLGLLIVTGVFLGKKKGL